MSFFQNFTETLYNRVSKLEIKNLKHSSHSLFFHSSISPRRPHSLSLNPMVPSLIDLILSPIVIHHPGQHAVYTAQAQPRVVEPSFSSPLVVRPSKLHTWPHFNGSDIFCLFLVSIQVIISFPSSKSITSKLPILLIVSVNAKNHP